MEIKLYELTHPQKRIWYVDRVNQNVPIYNIGGCLKINGYVNIDLMKKAINCVIENNDGLRLNFVENNNEIMQYIQSYVYEEIEFFDFSENEKPENEFREWSEKLFKENFEMENSKLYHFSIYKTNANDYGIFLKIHHIISDGWSISLIEKQICDAYSYLSGDSEKILTEKYSYLDYINNENEYLQSQKFNKNKQFWMEKFSDFSDENLYNTLGSSVAKRLSYDIDCKLSDEIKKFIDDEKISMNTFFNAIMAIYIYKTSNTKDVTIGVPIFNRVTKQEKNIIGMFTNTVPLRLKIDRDMNIFNFIKYTNRELKYCFVNQKYPYDFLVKDLDLLKTGYDSLFKICVNYYNSKYDEYVGEISLDVEEYYCGYQNYSMQMTVKEWDEKKITLNFDYKTMEYSDDSINEIYKTIINIIGQVIDNKEILVKNIKIADIDEQIQKTYILNATDCYYPRKTVCELFEEQVAKNPDKIAVEFREMHMTYNEVNKKSNLFGNYLIKEGVCKDDIVAIMLTNSFELIISILGIMKVCATYLPIEPEYPVERINYMLKDAKTSYLVVNFNMSKEVKFNGKVFNFESIKLDESAQQDIPIIKDCFDSLAYVIYTSGTTGNPKATMISHRGLTNYIVWANKTYIRDEYDTMPLYSSISLLILFMIAIFCCIHMLPYIFYSGVSWNFVFVWLPNTVKICLYLVYISIFLVGLYLILINLYKKKEDKSLWLMTILSVVSGFGNSLIIFTVNLAINSTNDMKIKLSIYFILGIVLYVFGQKIIRVKLIEITNGIVYFKRMEIVRCLLRTSYEKFENIEKGRIEATLNNDTETISSFVNIIISGVTSFVTLVFCFIYLGFINKYALLLSIMIILFIAGIYYFVGRYASKIGEESRNFQNSFFKFINDLIGGFKELSLSLKKKSEFEADMEKCCNKYKIKRGQSALAFANMFVIGELLFTVAIGAIALLFPLVLKNLDNTSASSYVFILLYMTGPVHGILNTIPSAIDVKISFKRINKLIDEIKNYEDGELIKNIASDVTIKLEDVEYEYHGNDREGFKLGPINYEFRSGETYFITGGNGSGKSTLSKLLSGLYIPSKGKIILNNIEKQNSLRENYSVIFSDFYLFEKLYGVNYENKTEEIQNYLKILQLDNKVKIENGAFSTIKLSTGQRKRLALLIAYLEDKPIYLFDEWAADQDPEFRSFFYNTLLKELKKEKKCVIVITHDEHYFDRAEKIIKMEMGQII